MPQPPLLGFSDPHQLSRKPCVGLPGMGRWLEYGEEASADPAPSWAQSTPCLTIPCLLPATFPLPLGCLAQPDLRWLAGTGCWDSVAGLQVVTNVL